MPSAPLLPANRGKNGGFSDLVEKPFVLCALFSFGPSGFLNINSMMLVLFIKNPEIYFIYFPGLVLGYTPRKKHLIFAPGMKTAAGKGPTTHSLFRILTEKCRRHPFLEVPGSGVGQPALISGASALVPVGCLVPELPCPPGAFPARATRVIYIMIHS
jgi:hypothetical protein